MDEHQDKVWALVADRQEQRVITGGSDSALVTWKDVTKLELDEKRNNEENLLLQWVMMEIRLLYFSGLL